MRAAWLVIGLALAILLTPRAHAAFSGAAAALPPVLPIPVDTGQADTSPVDAGPADAGPADAGPTDVQITALPGPEVPSLLAPSLYLPVIFNDGMPLRAERLGFNTAAPSIDAYPQIRALRAGWYLDWRVRTAPARPGGIDFVQTVRVHQRLACGTPEKPYGYGADRQRCPYASPPAYDVRPSITAIQQAARANPGSIWLIGNEMDAMDWEADGRAGYQDEMTPQLYAVAYHDLYTAIRAADPSARIAIGGVIQFTPLRQYYLEIILTTYVDLYGAPMPIDVWNIHNFVGPEYCRIDREEDDDSANGGEVNSSEVNSSEVSGSVVNGSEGKRKCYGMGIPPGIDVPYDDRGEQRGSYVGEDWRHTDMATFSKQIADLRTWMLHMGYGHVPLLISEYGVLYPSLCPQTDARAKQRCIDAYGSRYVDLENPAVVADFMVRTFEYFATAKDPAISLVDGGRLVQQWAWFSLEDVGWSFNRYGALFDRGSGQITATGRRFADYARGNLPSLQFSATTTD